MSHTDAPMDDILARLTAMQAALDAQQATIAQQQADIATLRQENAHWRQALASDALQTTPESSEMREGHDGAHDEAHDTAEEADAKPRGGLTSRRSLLRGAAAATAASVGAVALGAAQPAHAAPQANGSALVIGAVNTETAITELDNTNSGLLQAFLVTTNAGAGLQTAIRGSSLNGAVGVVGQDAMNGVGVYGYTQGGGGTGVFGSANAGSGVYGSATTGTGVFGQASGDGIGVKGVAGGAGDAVSGVTQESIAIHGSAGDAGWGVAGDSLRSYDFVANGLGIIGVNVQGSVGAPTSGFFFIGDCIRDANGDLWLCTAGDGTTVGTWVKAAHAIAGLPGGATSYLAKPIRLFDSRPGQPAASNPGHQLLPNTSTKVQVAGVTYNTVTVPSPLAGAIGNVTVLDASGGAFVEIVPSGAGFTGASTANIGGPGQIVANGFNVALSGGALDIYVAGVAVDVIIDLFAIVS